MNKFFYFAIISVFIAGCSSSPVVETNVKSVNTNVKTVETNVVANKSIVSAINQPIANVEPSPNANTTIQNFAVSKDNVRNTRGKKGASADDAPIAPNVTRAATAAPDNSEITNAMDAKGQPLETRTFKKHPVLVKIERTNLNNRDIKIYLKNGKVVNLPAGRVENFLTASADGILKAVGEN